MWGQRGAGHDALIRARRQLIGVTAPESEAGKIAALVALVVLVGLAVGLNVIFGMVIIPVLSLVIPVVFGGFLLTPRRLGVVFVCVFGAMIAENLGVGHATTRPASYVVMAIVCVIALQQSLDRQRLGLSAGRGDAMLLELRDRLELQGELPALPVAWHSELERQSAGGATFGGDFVVAARTADARMLELVIVDVSGKGLDAGSRALMLSGALGGMLGSVPPQRFMAAANEYLLRQNWIEGFATAMHLSIDLTTGCYRVASAGHLPAVHYHAGTGRWQVVQTEGAVLGVIEGEEFGALEGELRRGDALLLYTDGVVETPGRELSVGIDRLLGAAERLIPSGFEGGALRLLQDVSPTAADDRTIVLLWRS